MSAWPKREETVFISYPLANSMVAEVWRRPWNFRWRIKRGEKLTVKLIIDNVGVAPIYRKLPLYIRLKSENFQKDFETDIDIRKWVEGKYEEKIVLKVSEELLAGEYELQIGIGGKEEPSVVFACDAPRDGEYSVLTKLNVK